MALRMEMPTAMQVEAMTVISKVNNTEKLNVNTEEESFNASVKMLSNSLSGNKLSKAKRIAGLSLVKMVNTNKTVNKMA